MTPKEKAIELIDKFKVLDSEGHVLSWSCAKECALICVNEILETTKEEYQQVVDQEYRKSTRHNQYWQQVKQEIEKL